MNHDESSHSQIFVEVVVVIDLIANALKLLNHRQTLIMFGGMWPIHRSLNLDLLHVPQHGSLDTI